MLPSPLQLSFSLLRHSPGRRRLTLSFARKSLEHATAKVLEHIETEWVIRFLRNFADRLEEEAKLERDELASSLVGHVLLSRSRFPSAQSATKRPPSLREVAGA